MIKGLIGREGECQIPSGNPKQNRSKYGIKNIWAEVVRKKLDEYTETEYEGGNIDHEAAIELAETLHWGLKKKVTLEQYEEEERKKSVNKKKGKTEKKKKKRKHD